MFPLAVKSWRILSSKSTQPVNSLEKVTLGPKASKQHQWQTAPEVCTETRADQGPTYGVRLPRQLDAAVLQLLHALLQVRLLLHQRGEAMLQLLHGSPQGFMDLRRHSFTPWWTGGDGAQINDITRDVHYEHT